MNAVPIPGQMTLFMQPCPLCHHHTQLVVYRVRGGTREACEDCVPRWKGVSLSHQRGGCINWPVRNSPE